MKTQLLMQCNSRKTNHPYHGHGGAPTDEISLSAIYPSSDDPAAAEVKRFFAATPSAQLNFATVNTSAADMFEPGKQYRVTIEEAA